MAIDGVELRGRKLASAIKVQPVHCFKVIRVLSEEAVQKLVNDARAPRSGRGGHTWSGPRTWVST